MVAAGRATGPLPLGRLQDQPGVDLGCDSEMWRAGHSQTKASDPGGGRPHTQILTYWDNRS